jgi:hypothetical protein
MKKVRVRWNVKTVDDFLAEHGEDISADHLFLPSRDPFEPGTRLRFELLLVDRTPFLAGTAMVAGNPDDAKGRPGMMLWFEVLDKEHADVVDQLRARAEASGPWPVVGGESEGGEEEDTKPEANPGGLWDRLVGSKEGSDPG